MQQPLLVPIGTASAEIDRELAREATLSHAVLGIELHLPLRLACRDDTYCGRKKDYGLVAPIATDAAT